MITTSSAKPTRHERNVVMKPPEQRSDRRGDRSRGTHQGIHPLLRRSLEIAVDERLHRGQQERGAEPPTTAQNTMIAVTLCARVIAARRRRTRADPSTYARLRPMRSPTLLPIKMNAAETSASRAIADWTLLTVVPRSCTTAAIDTFINEVSTTSTNIAIASSSASRWSNAASSAEPAVPSVTRDLPSPDVDRTYHGDHARRVRPPEPLRRGEPGGRRDSYAAISSTCAS